MQKNRSVARKHHHIPKMVLKRFGDSKGKLWAARREGKSVFYVGAADLFAQRDLNTVTLSDGSKNIDLEEWYSFLESIASPFLDKLLSAVEGGKEFHLSENTWSLWHHFMYHHMKRQPKALMKAVEETKVLDVLRQSIDQELEKGETTLPEDTRENLERRLLQAAIVKARFLPPSQAVVGAFNQLGMTVFRAAHPRKSFVIGDCAASTAQVAGQIAFFAPISPQVALGFYSEPREIVIIDVDADTVRTMNEATAANSSIIAGRSDLLVKSLFRPRA